MLVELSSEELAELKKISNDIRVSILKMIYNAKSGHPGGSLSSVELILTLYKKILKHNSLGRMYKNRDRFILSKGHASATLYAVLAEEGYIPKEELLTFRKIGSKLQGHPSSRLFDVIEVSTGSLGQGLSIGCGMALGLKLDNIDSNVYVYLGDGEMQEGQVYEAIMNAAHHNLNNLIAIVDRNFYQIDGNTECVKSLGNIQDKFRAFGWQTLEVDGHDIDKIYQTYIKANNLLKENSKPVAIIANTIKGKGVPFMENTSSWHGKVPNEEQFKMAMDALGGQV